MYRDPIKVTQSLYRISEAMPSMKAIYYFGRGSATRFGWAMSLNNFPTDDFKKMPLHQYFGMGVALHCICQRIYQTLREAGVEIAGVRYEDIVADPTESMRTILRYCNFPEDNLEQCKKAMEFDSQAGSALSMTNLRKHPTLQYEGANKEEADRVCDLFKVPHVDQELILPGTITYKGKATSATS